MHCRAYPEIKLAPATTSRTWLFALGNPARRTWAGLRRQAVSLRQALTLG